MPVNRQFYLGLRPHALSESDPIRRAANFLYLNRTCFNGIFRVNRKGQFNVPFSGHRTGQLPSLDAFVQSAAALQKAQLAHADFEALVECELRPGDFVYLDPPYAVRNSRVFRQYGHDVFGLNDLLRLTRLLHRIHARDAFFLLSYADVEEIQPIAAEWHTAVYSVRRNIAGFSESRRGTRELAISNVKGEIS